MKPLGSLHSERPTAEAPPKALNPGSRQLASATLAPANAALNTLLPAPVCVDTHAHLHAAFELGPALHAALGHARDAGANTCVLCLTRTPQEQAFRKLRETLHVEGLRFEPAPGDPGVLLSRGDETRPSLVLVDGRQLVTAEKIEVLALAVPADAADALPSGLSLEKTLAAVTASGAVAVLPYGVGKWLGHRGRLVARAIDLAAEASSRTNQARFGGRRLCVADNAGRLTLGPRPPIFDQAAALGLTVLAGSDPLPLAGCGRRLGGLGVQLDSGLDVHRIGDTLRRELPMLGPAPRRFGNHAGLIRSVTEQAALRMLGRSQKRLAGRAA